MRFPEFTGEWKKVLLGQIANITKGNGISKEQLSDQGTPCILYGELYTKYKSEIINEIYSKTTLNSSALVKSQANDVIIPCSGETAIDISTARCVPYNDVLLGGDLNIIRLKSQNGGFFAYQLNGVRKHDIARIAQGVSVVHLYGENLKRIKVCYPSIEEQRKITSLLSLIDERIATQNKIIEKLETLMSAISNTLINHRDKIIKIGSICSIAEQIKADMSKCDKIITVRLHCKGVCRSSANNLELGATQYYVRQKGQLIWGKQNFHHGAIGIVPDNLDGGVTSKDIPSFDINSNHCCPKFILYQLQMPCYYEATEAYMTGTGSKRLKEETFLNMKISLPPLSEQREIAEAIETIEAKLNVEMALFDTYKLQKTYLLNQMFI